MSNVASVAIKSASTSLLLNVILDFDLHSEITWLFVIKYPFLLMKKPEPLAISLGSEILVMNSWFYILNNNSSLCLPI